MANVNILMATYNGARYIDKQILSIMAQSQGDWKLIIHDDGSTDSTISIVKHFCELDSRITFIDDGFKAHNAANHFIYMLQFADAPYICFCDQDDIWFENKLELMLRVLETKNNDTPQVLFSDAYLYHDISNKVDGKLLFVRPTQLREMLFTNGGIHGSASMFNAKMKEAMMVKQDFVAMHDHVLTLIGCSFGEVSYLDNKLFLYRQHQNNLTGNLNITKIGRLRKAFGSNNDKYTLSEETIKGVASFLKAYKNRLNAKDIRIIEQYLELKDYNALKRLLQIISSGFSLNHSPIQLLIKLSTRKFLKKSK